MKELVKEFLLEFKNQVLNVKKNELKKQIPNILTFSRALAPIIVIPTILFWRFDIAVVELMLFALTDFFDGMLARKFNCVTDFGVKLDAICDKLFALSVIIPAIIKYPILLINLFLEICISYINLMSELKNNNPRSNLIGKIKTAFLSATLILSYMNNVNIMYMYISTIMTFVFQIWAFFKYRESDINKDKSKKHKNLSK